MTLSVLKNDTWIFHGDSITDYNRLGDADGWGWGYVRMIAKWLQGRGGEFPKILNRAVSGNTIRNLAQGWEEDVIANKPQVLSVKIGVNDVWSGLVPGREGSQVPADEFRAIYDRLLARTREKLPDCKIVLCEPCGIWAPAPAAGNERLRPYWEIIGELAAKHEVFALVKLHEEFVKAKERNPEIDFTADGVHPTPAGDMVIAAAWMWAVGLLNKRAVM